MKNREYSESSPTPTPTLDEYLPGLKKRLGGGPEAMAQISIPKHVQDVLDYFSSVSDENGNVTGMTRSGLEDILSKLKNELT